MTLSPSLRSEMSQWISGCVEGFGVYNSRPKASKTQMRLSRPSRCPSALCVHACACTCLCMRACVGVFEEAGRELQHKCSRAFTE